MSGKDWCRNTAWGQNERDVFFRKLDRTRNKTGYLRVQGFTLLETHEASHYAPAIELFQLALREYPHEFENAQLHLGLGRCHEALNNFDEALRCFELSMTAQDAFPNMKANAYLDFCWLVAREKLNSRYDVALALLEKNKKEPFFPIEKYKHFGAAALIHADLEDALSAKDNARVAIQASQIKDSGARYHPHVGLVDNIDKHVHEKLEEIAS
jgi:tetratricopeptide (TPR) repeat protein